jgi:hypothetical protein
MPDSRDWKPPPAMLDIFKEIARTRSALNDARDLDSQGRVYDVVWRLADVVEDLARHVAELSGHDGGFK